MGEVEECLTRWEEYFQEVYVEKEGHEKLVYQSNKTNLEMTIEGEQRKKEDIV